MEIKGGLEMENGIKNNMATERAMNSIANTNITNWKI